MVDEVVVVAVVERIMMMFEMGFGLGLGWFAYPSDVQEMRTLLRLPTGVASSQKWARAR